MPVHYTPIRGVVNAKAARSTLPAVIRKRFTFRGTVQGVGFRPSVFRLAVSLDLSGFVQNRRSEVVVEVQGDADSVSRFAAEVAASMPPAARIQAMTETGAALLAGETGFRIIESGLDSFAFPPIPPDLPALR